MAAVVNILCTSKPCDGLLYYSYEYFRALGKVIEDVNLIIIPRKGYTKQNYIDSLSSKYNDISPDLDANLPIDKIYFDYFIPDDEDITLVLGRNIISNSYKNISDYNSSQVCTLQLLYNKIIVVYSEHNNQEYEEALKYWKPNKIYDLCDYEVYPNGVGKQFEKTIDFNLYKEPKKDIKVKNLLLGTNKDYYETAKKLIHKYDDYAILAYKDDFFIDDNLNHIWAPANNLLGSFENYIYAKEQFDPAPRIIQECKNYGMNIIYDRNEKLQDGGSVYMNRDIKPIDPLPIFLAIETMADFTCGIKNI